MTRNPFSHKRRQAPSGEDGTCQIARRKVGWFNDGIKAGRYSGWVSKICKERVLRFRVTEELYSNIRATKTEPD